MRSILELALPAMVASSLAASNPTLEMAWNTRSAGLTTSLKTVRKTNIGADVPDGLGDYARALARLGSAIPEGLADVLRRRTTGTANATFDINSGGWLTEVEFGTPPQNLPILLDTGSWDCVVFSSQSNQTLLPTDIPIYKPERSKTARLLDGYTFKILYGSGNDEANGDVFLDVLTIGGITASSQAVESVVNFTSVFAEVGGTGIVGMALDKNNTVRPIKQKTFFDNIKDQLAMPVLTADLYLSAQGSFNFGFINESLIDGDIIWADVDTSNSQQGWWSIPVEGFRVGSTPFIASPFLSIVDTGTTTVFFPPDAVKAYYTQVSGASNSSEFGGFVFPCNSSLPDFNVTISGVELTIPGDQLNLGTIQGNTCFGTMQTVPTPVVPDLPQPTAVLGATFMLRYVTAFDLGKLQVGFGQKRFIENVTLSSIP